MIERVTIGGREGSACFIDSKFKPVDEAKASFYKIVFDDGGQLFLDARKTAPPAKAKASYDEGEHPRDEHGRWTDGGGSDGGGDSSPSAGDDSKPSGGFKLPKVGPPSEDVHEVAQAAFEFYKVEGDKTFPVEHVHSGISAGDNPERIDNLVEQISGDDGHWSRPIVDDAGNVLEGQHRTEAAKQLGAKEIPVHVVKDLSRNKPMAAMKEAVRAAGPVHPDQVHQIMQNVLEAADESGSATQAREDFDFSGAYQEHHEAALKVLEQHEATSPPSVSVARVHQAKLDLVKVAQKEYDEWAPDEEGFDEEVGGGGICDAVSSAMSGVLADQGIETTEGGNPGDDHSWVIANLNEGVYEIDIPPGVYESGSGYKWSKIPDVTITTDDVVVNKIDKPMSDEKFRATYTDQ